MFVRALLKSVRGQLVLLMDRLPAHRSAWLLRQLRRYPRLHVEYFPPYAPELNPVEQLWKHCKYDRMANYSPATMQELSARIDRESAAAAADQRRLRSFVRASSLPLKLGS